MANLPPISPQRQWQRRVSSGRSCPSDDYLRGSHKFPGTNFRKGSGPGIKQVKPEKKRPTLQPREVVLTRPRPTAVAASPLRSREPMIAWSRIAWSSEALGLQARGKIVEE
jgi:hypothetical protein